MSDELKQKNGKLARNLVVLALLMFGFGYALVPLYNVLCKLTGQNVVVQAAGEQQIPGFVIDESRTINIEFITSINETTPMSFRAELPMLKVHPGQYYTVNFFAKNNTNGELKAQAIPSITPGLTEQFFKKIQCFCFTTQVFEPKQEKTLSVRFAVDPQLPERYKTITLSYTFFDRTNITEN